jgi:hypothetical protein
MQLQGRCRSAQLGFPRLKSHGSAEPSQAPATLLARHISVTNTIFGSLENDEHIINAFFK